MMRYKLIVFDLDGTLLNTLDDLAAAGNYCLAARGFPVHPVEAYKKFIGSGIYNLVGRSLPEERQADEALIQAMAADFAEYYKAHSVDYTAPYEGVLEMLRQLREKGSKLAVLTNKPHDRAVELCEGFFPGLLDLVYGQREGYPIKPDPQVLFDIVSSMGAVKERCVYVGDSGVDIKTGNNAGIDVVAVSWGFCTKEELEVFGAGPIVNQVSQLYKVLISS